MFAAQAALFAVFGCAGVVFEAVWVAGVVAGVAGVDAGGGVVVFAAAAGAGAGVAGAGVAGAPTVTCELIFEIVAALTPAFDKSLTALYGRPAMIFFAVAGPTPFKDSSCDWVALLRSIGPAGAVFAGAFLESASTRPGMAMLSTERKSVVRNSVFIGVLAFEATC